MRTQGPEEGRTQKENLVRWTNGHELRRIHAAGDAEALVMRLNIPVTGLAICLRPLYLPL